MQNPSFKHIKERRSAILKRHSSAKRAQKMSVVIWCRGFRVKDKGNFFFEWNSKNETRNEKLKWASLAESSQNYDEIIQIHESTWHEEQDKRTAQRCRRRRRKERQMRRSKVIKWIAKLLCDYARSVISKRKMPSEKKRFPMSFDFFFYCFSPSGTGSMRGISCSKVWSARHVIFHRSPSRLFMRKVNEFINGRHAVTKKLGFLHNPQS